MNTKPILNKTATNYRPDTIIDASLELEVIKKAISTYLTHLREFLYTDNLSTVSRYNMPEEVNLLAQYFDKNLSKASDEIVGIIEGINKRASERRSSRYLGIVSEDSRYWRVSDAVLVEFGVFACVDKGIPFEAVCGVDGQIGRTLGGDLDIEFIPYLQDFYLTPSAISKRLIHLGRSGIDYLVEPMIEHTGCGRRAQIMGNEHAANSIPSEGFVFANIEKLAKTLPESASVVDQLLKIKTLWKSYSRDGQSVVTPDQGLYSGIVFKMAQRQALYNIEELNILSPIEIYDKQNGDLIVGIDNPSILTDDNVLAQKGYTKSVLAELINQNKIFSFTQFDSEVSLLLSNQSEMPKYGSYSYSDLQNMWMDVQEKLVLVTNHLWQLYEVVEEKDSVVRQMVKSYLEKAMYHTQGSTIPNVVVRRLIHHMFHCYAYTYLFATLQKGNVPGNHIESYLATGDHDTGAKAMTPLGQGDLARPSASEMFTQYVVLQHSDGLPQEMPVIATIKQDTDRGGDEPISTEETTVAQEDFKEFMKLWPYFMVGDLIPVLVIRGKQKGGVSRLGLSILLSLHSMGYLLESKKINLPAFVPANTPSGEVTMVPGVDILQAGINAKGDLREFRHNVQKVALQYANRDIQAKLMS
jgi:hypothetical protein